MAEVQAKFGTKYLPLIFDDAQVTGPTGFKQGLWYVSDSSMAGCVSCVTLENNGSVLNPVYQPHYIIAARSKMTLMTNFSSTNPYSNYGAFASSNYSEYRNEVGDSFNPSGKYALKRITNSRKSDIVVVPSVVCKKFTEAELNMESTASFTSGTKTYTMWNYLNGSSNGTPYHQLYPHVIGIRFAVFCRTSATPDGFGVDAEHTSRSKIMSVGGTNSNYITVNGNACMFYPVTASSLTSIENYKLSNSNLEPDTAFAKSNLWVTGLSNTWEWSANGGWSNGMSCVPGSLIRVFGIDPDDNQSVEANPKLGTNTLWANWNPNSSLVTHVWGEAGAVLSNYRYLSFIDCYDNPGKVRQLVNMMGFMWAETEASAKVVRPGDSNAHCPVFGSNGIPTGEDEIGTDETEQTPLDVTDPDPDPENPNDPDPPRDIITPPYIPNPDDDPSNPKDPNLPGGGGTTGLVPEPTPPNDVTNGSIVQVPDVSGTHKYVISRTTLDALINYLGTTYKPDAATLNADFKGQNPLDYIVSCKLYPLSPSYVNSPIIQLGGLNTGIAGTTFSDYGVKVIHMGSITFNGYYNSWLDFAPYTTISIYVPFCGTIELDPSIWMYHTLDVYISVDFNTGCCSALLFRDGAYISSMEGVMGVDIQLYGKNQGDYQNSLYRAQYSANQAKINESKAILNGVTNPFGFTPTKGAVTSETSAGTVGASMVGDAMRAAGGFGNNVLNLSTTRMASEAAEWNVEHIAPKVASAGTQDPFCYFSAPMFCRVIIKRAQMISGFNIGTYKATVGLACMRTGKVSDFRGRIVCSGIYKTDGAMMAEEIEAVKSKLKSGVYVTPN